MSYFGRLALSWLALTPLAAGSRPQTGESCWKGELEQHSRNFTGSDGKVSSIRLVYDLYQNKAGIVRRELKSSEPPIRGGLGIGRDVAIIDFARGSMIAFDKHQPKALRFNRLEGFNRDPIKERASAVPGAAGGALHERLEPMKVLGYLCERVVNRTTSGNQGLLEERVSWVASSVGFRHPLLDIVTRFVTAEAARKSDLPEGLLSVVIRTVTHLERVDHLDDSLFQLPPGYEVTEVPASTR